MPSNMKITVHTSTLQVPCWCSGVYTLYVQERNKLVGWQGTRDKLKYLVTSRDRKQEHSNGILQIVWEAMQKLNGACWLKLLFFKQIKKNTCFP